MNYKFAENLKKLREEKGLSQKQLGKLMFVAPSTIARWENGSRLPDAVMILRLAGCLGVDANTLFYIWWPGAKNAPTSSWWTTARSS